MIATPPKLVRRLVVAPLILGAEATVVAASPALGLLAVATSPLVGGRRPLRVLAIVVAYSALHVVCTLACLGLWIASGFGRHADAPWVQRRHYALLRWFVGRIYRTLARVGRVDLRVTESEAAAEVLSGGERPVVLLSRHAGEGDSLLVLHELLCRHGRRPRVVLHEALRIDPLIDVLGARLPNRFVDPRGGDTEAEIAAMASDVGDDDAVLIFPEGANFTAARRLRGIARLRHAGHHEEAGWADAMDHVVAPRPGGTLAALDAAPHADVVFLAHVGVPVGAREVWRRLPDRQTVEVRLWLAPAAEIPADPDARIDWLFGWWRTVDAWVGERHRAGS